VRRKKPSSWNGSDRMCTSPFKVKKGGCMGEIDFGQGIQYEIKGKERQRYCVPCNAKISRGEEVPAEEPVQTVEESGTKCQPEKGEKS